jgi:hypothetical protein
MSAIPSSKFLIWCYLERNNINRPIRPSLFVSLFAIFPYPLKLCFKWAKFGLIIGFTLFLWQPHLWMVTSNQFCGRRNWMQNKNILALESSKLVHSVTCRSRSKICKVCKRRPIFWLFTNLSASTTHRIDQFVWFHRQYFLFCIQFLLPQNC